MSVFIVFRTNFVPKFAFYAVFVLVSSSAKIEKLKNCGYFVNLKISNCLMLTKVCSKIMGFDFCFVVETRFANSDRYYQKIITPGLYEQTKVSARTFGI